MIKWPHDDLQSKIAFYGDPRKNKFEDNLVSITPPFQMYYDKQALKTIRVHEKIATSVLLALIEILDNCGHDQKQIDIIGASNWGGCYNFRPVRGSVSNLSNHAFGAALDIDPAHNPLGSTKAKSHPIIIAAFKNQGALWGGDYKGRKDPMHFEFVSR